MAVEMTLSGSWKTDISVSATRAFDLATGTVPLRKTVTNTVSSAAASVTCDLIWQSTGTIAGGGAAVDIDLNDAAACAGIMEYWGEDETVRKAQFDRVHFLYIRNTTAGAAAGDSVLRVGADATPFPWFFVTPAGDTIDIAPGALVNSVAGTDCGWPVGAGATDILQLANNDAVHALTYEIIVVGESVSSATTTTTTTVAPTTTTAAATTTTVAPTTTTTTTTTTAAPTTTTTTAAPTTTTAPATTTT